MNARGRAARVVWIAAPAIIGAFVVGFIVREVRAFDPASLALFHFEPVPLALAYGVQTAGWLMVVMTWARLVGSAPPRLGAATHLSLYAVSALAHVVPGSVWAPASRIALYRRAGVNPLRTGAAVIMEWLLVGIAGLVLYALSAPFSSALPPSVVRPLAAVAFAGLALLHPAIRAPLIRRAAPRFGAPAAAASSAISELTAHSVAVFLLVETTALALSGLGFYLLMVGVAPKASLADAMSAWAMTVAIANLFAWMPMTSIIKDGGMILLLTPLYGSAIVSGAVVVAWRIWAISLQLSWAAIATGLVAIGRRDAS